MAGAKIIVLRKLCGRGQKKRPKERILFIFVSSTFLAGIVSGVECFKILGLGFFGKKIEKKEGKPGIVIFYFNGLVFFGGGRSEFFLGPGVPHFGRPTLAHLSTKVQIFAPKTSGQKLLGKVIEGGGGGGTFIYQLFERGSFSLIYGGFDGHPGPALFKHCGLKREGHFRFNKSGGIFTLFFFFIG